MNKVLPVLALALGVSTFLLVFNREQLVLAVHSVVLPKIGVYVESVKTMIPTFTADVAKNPLGLIAKVGTVSTIAGVVAVKFKEYKSRISQTVENNIHLQTQNNGLSSLVQETNEQKDKAVAQFQGQVEALKTDVLAKQGYIESYESKIDVLNRASTSACDDAARYKKMYDDLVLQMVPKPPPQR